MDKKENGKGNRLFLHIVPWVVLSAGIVTEILYPVCETFGNKLRYKTKNGRGG